MPAVDDALSHDSTSLFRFVESICAFCSAERRYPTYLEGSRTFLRYIAGLGEATKSYLADFPAQIPSRTAEFNLYRQELALLRNSWFEIHRRVKPVADADTLGVPASLVRALVERLRQIRGFRTSDFSLFHTERLNYLQVVATNIRDTVEYIASIIGARRFPAKLALIGIPYSQSESLFLNCLIAHEIGHFVFGERGIKNRLANPIDRALRQAFAGVSGLGPQERAWIPTIIADWAEELFCDLFAIRFIRPCYSYAFTEIFDLPNILNRSRRLEPTAAATSLEFSDSHPPDLYRIQKQVQLLARLGWWTQIRTRTNHYVRVLEVARALPVGSFTFPQLSHVQGQMVNTISIVVPRVVDLIQELLESLPTGVDEYRQIRSLVTEYFAHGVVPSTIPSAETPFPSPATVLNVAYEFYLDHLSELVGAVEGASASVSKRNVWLQRLELWTLKAMEDYQLLSARGI